MASKPFLPISKHITGFKSQLAAVWLVCGRKSRFHLHLYTLGLACVLAIQLVNAFIGNYYFVFGLEMLIY